MSEKDLSQQVDSFDDGHVYQSPTLTSLAIQHSKLLPKDESLACLRCPNAIWMVPDKRTLQCWCQTMRVMSWTSKEQVALPLCDGMFVGDDEE